MNKLMKKLYTLLVASAMTSFAAMAAPGYTMLNYTIAPADGETVTSLNEIAITFPDPVDGIDVNIMSGNIGEYATLTCGDKVIKATGINAGIRDLQTAYITFPETTDPGTYVFNLDKEVLKDYDEAETADEGEGYSVNPPIKATYTIKGASVPETTMSVYTIDPADGSELEGIHSITIEFLNTSEGIGEYVSNPIAFLYKDGEKVAETTNLEMLSDYTSVQVTFETTIKDPGEYTFVLPAETYKDFSTYGDDVVANPEIRATYIVKGIVDGVDNIAVDSADKTVYDLFGRKLDNAAKLPAGIYIVNGKKTIVR